MSLEDLGILFVGVGFAWFCCSPPTALTGHSGIVLAQVMLEEACFNSVIH